MAALTNNRSTLERVGNQRVGALAASAKAFAGALLMRNAAGYVLAGATATGSVGIGRCEQFADNSAGSAGDLSVGYLPGVFRFNNSSGADEITLAQIGDVCFIVDDQTVAKTADTASRSPAGIVEGVDAQGVWVRFDEALTKTAAA